MISQCNIYETNITQKKTCIIHRIQYIILLLFGNEFVVYYYLEYIQNMYSFIFFLIV